MTTPMHDYLSTACGHGNCANCRLTCKFCDSPCQHGCHQQDGTKDLPPSWVDQARDIARELWGFLTHPEYEGSSIPPWLADRVRDDPALFWLRGEEQPPGRWGGEISEGRKVLDTPMGDRYPTVRDALARALSAFWFNDAVAVTSTIAIYRALNRAGLTDVAFDEWDLPTSGKEEADRLIRAAIDELGSPAQPPGVWTPKEPT